MWAKLSCADRSPAPVKGVACHQAQKAAGSPFHSGLQRSPTLHSKSPADLPSPVTQHTSGLCLDLNKSSGLTVLKMKTIFLTAYTKKEMSFLFYVQVYTYQMDLHAEPGWLVSVCDPPVLLN